MKISRILLVDNDADDRDVFRYALQEVAMQVQLSEASSGLECLGYLEKSDFPDIIFLDLNMPGMDGLQCLKKIRSLTLYESIIICIYSTSSAEKDVNFTFTNGADLFIKKPFTIQELKVTLEKVFTVNWTEHRKILKKENFLLSL